MALRNFKRKKQKKQTNPKGCTGKKYAQRERVKGRKKEGKKKKERKQAVFTE